MSIPPSRLHNRAVAAHLVIDELAA